MNKTELTIRLDEATKIIMLISNAIDKSENANEALDRVVDIVSSRADELIVEGKKMIGREL